MSRSDLCEHVNIRMLVPCFMKHLLVPLKAIYDIVLNQNQSPWFNHDLSLKLMLYFLSFLLNAKKKPQNKRNKTKRNNKQKTKNKRN